LPDQSTVVHAGDSLFRLDELRGAISHGLSSIRWAARGSSHVTPRQAVAFVRKHGVVLEAAAGPVPSLTVEIAGGAIRGSWWQHPRSHEIF
jgi:hypothetical protein